MKTRYSTLATILLVVSLLAAGCSSAASGTSTDAAVTENADGGLNEPTRLALGILKLEDTGQAVTTEQAADLLTLWQAYQALGNSETTAKVELEAVVDQIQAALTTEQVKAIDAMGLTSESMTEVMQAFGAQFGPDGTPGVQSTPQAGSNTSGGGFSSGFQGGQGMPSGGGEMPSGGFQVGGMPPGGGMAMDDSGSVMMGGAMGTPDPNAQNQFSSVGSQVNPMLLRALISVLKTNAQSSQ
jgi:hypothetical protein